MIEPTEKPAAMERRTWNVAEAAEQSGLSEKTIRTYIDQGLMPGRRLGRRILIPKGAFAEWLEEYLRGDWPGGRPTVAS